MSRTNPYRRAALGAVTLLLAAQVNPSRGQDWQGPLGANYLAAQSPPYSLTGSAVVLGIIEHPLGGSGIESPNNLDTRLLAQWDLEGQIPPLGWNGLPCPDPPAVFTGSSAHATLVADIAAGGPGVYVGVAPQALVYAGHITASNVFATGLDTTRAASDWLRQFTWNTYGLSGLRVANYSFGYPGNADGQGQLALFVDWFVNNWGPLVVVAAGNDFGMIREPGDLYNGITVGATDASMLRRLADSNFDLNSSIRSKPDILAPGTDISDGFATTYGTSLAAPFVTGTATLLAENFGPGLGPNSLWHRMAKAVILNSARKRFISGENSANGVSKDNSLTSADESDYDYLDGAALRIGGSGSGPKTENWTPAIWTRTNNGPLLVSAPLDDEQGVGFLDTTRAVIQMNGAGLSGMQNPNDSPPAPAYVTPIAWSAFSVDPATVVRDYYLNFPVAAGEWLTVTLCWDRDVSENQPDPCGGIACPPPCGLGQVDQADTYVVAGLANLDLQVYHAPAGGPTELVAASQSAVDNVEHLHIPLPGPGAPAEYLIRVQLAAGDATAYALAWWVGLPPAPPQNFVDCNNNGVPDGLDIVSAFSADCNDNDVPDECDIAAGTSLDCNNNGVPDECEGSGVLGTFATTVNPTALNPFSLCSTDLDGDGDADLIVGHSGDGPLSILLNNGNGTFAAPVSVDVLFPTQVVAARLDANNSYDLAVASVAFGGVVYVLLNNGDGSFATPTTYSVGSAPCAIVAADLDGDLDADLAVANAGSNNVSILLNNGDGTFTAAGTFATGPTPNAIAAADLDGDGDIDLVTADQDGSSVSLLLNDGNGAFAAPAFVTVGNTPYFVAAGDLDGDGDRDLAVCVVWTGTPSNHRVVVLLNNGNATFATGVEYPVGSFPRTLAIGDLDSDGDRDIVTANLDADSVSILRNNGNGTFAAAVNIPVGDYPQYIVMKDLDGNGARDLAVTCQFSHAVYVLLQQALGLGGDWDADGDVDAVDFAALPDCLTGPNSAPAPTPPECAGQCLKAFDFDGDGDVDLADFAAFQVLFAGGG